MCRLQRPLCRRLCHRSSHRRILRKHRGQVSLREQWRQQSPSIDNSTSVAPSAAPGSKYWRNLLLTSQVPEVSWAGGSPGSADIQGGQTSFNLGSGRGTNHNFTIPRGVLKHPRGLPGNPERGENRAVGVVNIGEGQAVTGNEVIDVPGRSVPADPNDLHLAGPFLADRLDRGGFTVARASIRRPEPKGNGRAVVPRPEVGFGRGGRIGRGLRRRISCRCHIGGRRRCRRCGVLFGRRGVLGAARHRETHNKRDCRQTPHDPRRS